ncbi:MAG: hypothetical protein SV253_06840 [Halobacteria archaeon]|nr:hypothetical protein [Halobacteria archaeon]
MGDYEYLPDPREDLSPEERRDLKKTLNEWIIEDFTPHVAS